MNHDRSIARHLGRGLLLATAVVALVASTVACSSTDDAKTDGGSGGSTIGAQSNEHVPNDSPGVTDTEIKYAAFGTITGNPTGLCFAECFDAGAKAYFEWRNSQGGIYGRKLVMDQEFDDQLVQNQQAALQVVSASDNVFGAFSATALASGWKDVAEAGIPLYTLGVAFDERNGKDGIYSSLGVQCLTCTQRRIPYIASLAKAKKVAALGYGIAQSSKDCVASTEASVKKYGDKTGQSVAYVNADLPYGLPNGVAPEVTAMKNAGVDFINTCLDLNGVKTLEQELERQGMGKTTVMMANAYDHDIYKENSDLFEGDYVAVGFRPFEADTGKSQLADFKEWMGKTGHPANEIAIQGWANADLAYQGLKAAGPSFTRQSVIDATNKLTAWNAGGMIVPIDWTREHVPWTDADPVSHAPAKECIAFVQWKGGQFTMVGDKAKPFTCWPGDPSQWTDPTPTDFE